VSADRRTLPLERALIALLLSACVSTPSPSEKTSRSGHLQFDASALSPSAAACARGSAAHAYLTGTVVRAWAESWARRGDSVEAGEFTAALVFSLTPDAQVDPLQLDFAQPVAAGEETLASFRQAAPFPAIPKEASCLVGQMYRLQVRHSLAGEAPR